MNIGRRLKDERERLGMSQTEFAAIAGASKHAQINWEKGDATPNANALAAWAEKGLDVLYVVTGSRSFCSPTRKPSAAIPRLRRSFRLICRAWAKPSRATRFASAPSPCMKRVKPSSLAKCAGASGPLASNSACLIRARCPTTSLMAGWAAKNVETKLNPWSRK